MEYDPNMSEEEYIYHYLQERYYSRLKKLKNVLTTKRRKQGYINNLTEIAKRKYQLLHNKNNEEEEY